MKIKLTQQPMQLPMQLLMQQLTLQLTEQKKAKTLALILEQMKRKRRTKAAKMLTSKRKRKRRTSLSILLTVNLLLNQLALHSSTILKIRNHSTLITRSLSHQSSSSTLSSLANTVNQRTISYSMATTLQATNSLKNPHNSQLSTLRFKSILALVQTALAKPLKRREWSLLLNLK